MQEEPERREIRKEIKDGLYEILKPTGERKKLLSFHNDTSDTQFNLTYKFNDDAVIFSCGETKMSNDGRYAVKLYPGDTKHFIEGVWNGWKRSMSYGPPDEEWQEQQMNLLKDTATEEINRMKSLLKRLPTTPPNNKYTADFMADACERDSPSSSSTSSATVIKFVDLTFPPKESSLWRDYETALKNYPWMRPSAYCGESAAPLMVDKGIEPNDIDQGFLGDCYYLCALACVAEFPHLIQRCLSLPQNPMKGIYRVRLCKHGWWSTIVLDDFLPISPVSRLPIFARNREQTHELWVSLMEKAYAKAHGSYSSIAAGDAAQALADICGTPFTRFDSLPEWEDKSALFEKLCLCDQQNHLMVVWTAGEDASAYTGKESTDMSKSFEAAGLCAGHAYSLLKVCRTSTGERLCKIRNPWGGGTEWNGAWSDHSDLWTPELKREVQFEEGDDGIFWMAWKDVQHYFEGGSITYNFPRWGRVRIAGNFDEGIPDVVVRLHVQQQPCECWFGLHQRDRRGAAPGSPDSQYIGLLASMYLANSDREEDGAMSVEKYAQTQKGTYLISREVFEEKTLQPGVYYFLCQSYHERDKSFVASLFLSNPSGVNIEFLSFKEGSITFDRLKRYRFRPETCDVPAMAQYQVAGVGEDLLEIYEGEGRVVDWNLWAKKKSATSSTDSEKEKRRPVQPTHPVAALKPKPAAMLESQKKKTKSEGEEAAAPMPHEKSDKISKEHEENDGDEMDKIMPIAEATPPTGGRGGKHQDPTSPDMTGPAHHVPTPTPTPTTLITGKNALMKLQVTVISGRNLAAKDITGTSDPYVYIKRYDSKGVRYRKTPEMLTKYVPNTLNPTWGTTFTLDVLPTDSLIFECWDKDLFGRDPMGAVTVKISELGLKRNGPGKVEYFPLVGEDATGDLQLLFSAV